jgi:hypothetical protein
MSRPSTCSLDLFQRQRAVGARDGDDLVLGILGADDDQRHAGHLVGRLGDGTRVHALPLQLLDHRRAVLQQADARRERHARTQPRRGHRLVGTLAAQAGTEALAAQRLARLRQPRRMHDEVAVDAAEHEDLRGGGHRRSGSPK